MAVDCEPHQFTPTFPFDIHALTSLSMSLSGPLVKHDPRQIAAGLFPRLCQTELLAFCPIENEQYPFTQRKEGDENAGI